MTTIIETRIKKIGNSFWALIPRDVIDEKRLKEDQEIKLSIIIPDRDRILNEISGIFKGAKGFERDDHGERAL